MLRYLLQLHKYNARKNSLNCLRKPIPIWIIDDIFSFSLKNYIFKEDYLLFKRFKCC